MLKDLPLCLQTSTDAWAWCYVKRSSLVLAQTLDARAGRGTEPQTRTIYKCAFVVLSVYSFLL